MFLFVCLFIGWCWVYFSSDSSGSACSVNFSCRSAHSHFSCLPFGWCLPPCLFVNRPCKWVPVKMDQLAGLMWSDMEAIGAANATQEELHFLPLPNNNPDNLGYHDYSSNIGIPPPVLPTGFGVGGVGGVFPEDPIRLLSVQVPARFKKLLGWWLKSTNVPVVLPEGGPDPCLQHHHCSGGPGELSGHLRHLSLQNTPNCHQLLHR